MVVGSPFRASIQTSFSLQTQVVNDRGRYHTLTMSREFDPQPDQKLGSDTALDAPADELADIDPAEFSIWKSSGHRCAAHLRLSELRFNSY